MLIAVTGVRLPSLSTNLINETGIIKMSKHNDWHINETGHQQCPISDSCDNSDTNLLAMTIISPGNNYNIAFFKNEIT